MAHRCGWLGCLVCLVVLCPVTAAEPPAARRDRYGDALPERALYRIGTARTPTERPPLLALTPDGKTLVANASDPRAVILWDVAAGRELHILSGHEFEVTSAAFSPDGKRLATASRDWTVRLWDVASGKHLAALENESTEVNAVAWAPDGRHLAAASNDLLIRLWDPERRKVVKELKGHGDAVLTVAFSPDGATLASGGDDKRVRLWDVKTGAMQRTLEGHLAPVYALTFTPDGRTLASAGKEAGIFVWDVATGKLQRQLDTEAEALGSLAFADNGLLLYGDLNGMIGLWQTGTGKKVRGPLHTYASWVAVLPAAKDGTQVFAGDSGGAVGVWDFTKGQRRRILGASRTPIQALAFSADSRRLALGYRQTITIHDTATGARALGAIEPLGSSLCLAFAPDGRLLAASDRSEHVQLYDTATGEHVHFLKGHQGEPTTLMFSRDGRTLISSDVAGGVRVWEVARGHLLRTFEHDPTPADEASRRDRLVRLALPGAELFTGNDRGVCQRWDIATGKALFSRTLSKPATDILAIAADGRTLAASTPDGTVSLRQTATGRFLATLDSQAQGVTCAVFSPDGRWLATAGIDKRVRLWETITGSLAATFDGHERQVASLAFAPNGRLLASGSEDTTVLVWDARLDGAAPADSMEQAWKDLGDRDVGKALRGVAACVATPDPALLLFKEGLRPAPRPDVRRIAALVGDLDHARFEVRQAATNALEKLGAAAEPALLKLLADKPALEVRQRVDTLLNKLEKQPLELTADQLRTLRAIAVLERVDSAAARQLLKELAQGDESSLVTQEAAAALARLR